MEVLERDREVHSVVSFIPRSNTAKLRVKVTRIGNEDDFRVNIGRPNYKEKEYLKLCKKAKSNPKYYWIVRRRNVKG